jgi:hypothetical protein
MTRNKKDFTFSNGKSLVIQQANLRMSWVRDEIEEQARADRLHLNGTGDPELLFFQEIIYSGLAAVSEGDVPELADAFRLSPADLDAWHIAAAEINPAWYTVHEYRQEEVEINGHNITILSLRPSVMMRRVHFENEATKGTPAHTAKEENFRLLVYPMLAGCSKGDVPTFDEAIGEWSMDELQSWYEVARRVLPEWFTSLEEQAAQNKEATEQGSKKKSKSTAR